MNAIKRAYRAVRLLTRIRQEKPELWKQIQEFAMEPDSITVLRGEMLNRGLPCSSGQIADCQQQVIR